MWKNFRKRSAASERGFRLCWKRAEKEKHERTKRQRVQRRTESQIKDEVLAGQKMSWHAYRANDAAAAAAATTATPATPGKKYKTGDPGCGPSPSLPPWSCRSPRNHHTFCRHSACTGTNCVRRERQQNVKYATRRLLPPPPLLSLSLSHTHTHSLSLSLFTPRTEASGCDMR